MAPWWLRTSNDEVFEDTQVDGTQAESPQVDSPQADHAQAAPRPAAPPPMAAPAEAAQATTDRTAPSAGRSVHEKASGEGTPEQVAAGEEVPVASEEPNKEARPRKRKRRRRRRRGGGAGAAESVGERAEAKGERSEPAEKRSEKRAVRRLAGSRDAQVPVDEVASERSTGVRSAEVPAEHSVASESAESAAGPERGIVFTLPERQSFQDERKIAMFCDFENIALGVRDSEIKELDINMVLSRLLEKGKIIVKKAYADWERYSDYKRPFHEAAIELIDIPQKYYSGKNSADIKMVVDAMDLCYSKEHLDTFVILSGDSDFSPLVSKLKENNKYVIGIGVKNSSSSLLIDNCDEFIYYEDVWRATQQKPRLDNLPAKEAEVFGLMSDAMLALIREDKGVLWGSMIKQTMQRMRPSFSESYYGYSTFSELLEAAAQRNIIGLKRDQRSGNYVVTGFIPSR